MYAIFNLGICHLKHHKKKSCYSLIIVKQWVKTKWIGVTVSTRRSTQLCDLNTFQGLGEQTAERAQRDLYAPSVMRLSGLNYTGVID